MNSALGRTAPWVMSMRWRNLAFLHWPVSAEALRPLIPAGLTLDLYDGQAWLGVVPFEMRRTRGRWMPPCPTAANFPELNVRTYVTRDDRPGVWFFSLDAASRLVVRAARRTYHLPYFDARMSIDLQGNQIRYCSQRTDPGGPSAEFTATYQPVGEVYGSQPGDLDYWLTERYCLYSADRRGEVYRGEIRHRPWPLQPAVVVTDRNTMGGPLAVSLESPPPVVHFARQLDVVAWWPVRVES